jgi:hypothetical protein
VKYLLVMKIVTALSDLNNKGFNDYLKSSCEHHNLELEVLEIGSKYTTHRLKDVLLEKYLEGVHDDEIILFSDAYDTIILADKTEILKKFYHFNSPLVFSAEINCWPSKDLAQGYPTSDYQFKYLNAGAFIGTAGFIKSMYKHYPPLSFNYNKYVWSNQYYWHNVYLQNLSGDIKLDHACELFYNTALTDEKLSTWLDNSDAENINMLVASEKDRLSQEISFYDNRIEYLLTKTHPCHLHFPGPISKILMTENYFESVKRK